MNDLVKLVREILTAPDVDRRLRTAEALARQILADLQVFLRHMRRERPEVAEEALQETLAAVFQHLHQFRGQTDAEFWSWCHRIARNKASDERRQPWTQRQESLDTESLASLIEASAQDLPLSPGERLDLEYTLNLVKHAKPPCYQHLIDHFILGWDYTEIAQANHITYDAAKVTIRRCLELARALVKQGD